MGDKGAKATIEVMGVNIFDEEEPELGVGSINAPVFDASDAKESG